MPKKPYPPFILLAGILINIAAGMSGWPAGLEIEISHFWTRNLIVPVGVALMLLGLMAGISVSRQFKAYETSIVPDHRPASIISDGLFAYSRNPIYLSMVVILVGAALISGNGTGFFIAFGFGVWVRWRWIPLEEANMRRAFGAEFEAYCQAVRRWI